MPQLEKGGKWVFGWSIVGVGGEIAIPPAAFSEYGFRVGSEVLFLRGSRRSGGLIIGLPERLAQSKISLQSRVIEQGCIEAGGRIKIPEIAGVNPGSRLLVVRGSRLALSFLAYGPIVEIAQNHPEIEIFV
ncbi:hypothetical protein ADN00_05480 [Ornatilinea apprima]|uniref:Uncharacterized protein n=1 Tax=Ornatilinea apprima TaxID=1134406 RepID=A0A0P6XPU0_9CHLR|nr:hypothetical protein [Ornatilinea apprima]KPL78699.1 hypothetical protein ADN00_05480 [Ornatilinea apprima]